MALTAVCGSQNPYEKGAFGLTYRSSPPWRRRYPRTRRRRSRRAATAILSSRSATERCGRQSKICRSVLGPPRQDLGRNGEGFAVASFVKHGPLHEPPSHALVAAKQGRGVSRATL